jgi:hypothetical protein
MRCNASTASCIAADSDARVAAANALEAIIFREVLKPLAAGLGPVGETAIGTVADKLFVRPKP